MSLNLVQEDILLCRARYDEALEMQGVPCTYQYPNFAGSTEQGEPLIDSYSDFKETHIFFDGNPKLKTLKRYGWVVENNEELPFLIHCSWNLPSVQKDSIFRIAGHYASVPDRIFRVTEITYDLQVPDHLVCKVVPVYDETTLVGRTRTEISKTFSTSNHFLNIPTDYRGQYYDPEGERR